ncbi:hypothetical protein FOZ62_013454, partial [Perkinsus olseni]
MCHLIIPLLLAFLYEVAAFPPNKLYVSIADSARPVSSGLRGDIPWKADHCGILLKLDTSNKNFKAFAKKFDLKAIYRAFSTQTSSRGASLSVASRGDKC